MGERPRTSDVEGGVTIKVISPAGSSTLLNPRSAPSDNASKSSRTNKTFHQVLHEAQQAATDRPGGKRGTKGKTHSKPTPGESRRAPPHAHRHPTNASPSASAVFVAGPLSPTASHDELRRAAGEGHGGRLRPTPRARPGRSQPHAVRPTKTNPNLLAVQHMEWTFELRATPAPSGSGHGQARPTDHRRLPGHTPVRSSHVTIRRWSNPSKDGQRGHQARSLITVPNSVRESRRKTDGALQSRHVTPSNTTPDGPPGAVARVQLTSAGISAASDASARSSHPVHGVTTGHAVAGPQWRVTMVQVVPHQLIAARIKPPFHPGAVEARVAQFKNQTAVTLSVAPSLADWEQTLSSHQQELAGALAQAGMPSPTVRVVAPTAPPFTGFAFQGGTGQGHQHPQPERQSSTPLPAPPTGAGSAGGRVSVSEASPSIYNAVTHW